MWTCPSCMAMHVSSRYGLARGAPGGACRRSLAARAEELNRHSPDCWRFREQDRAFDRLGQRKLPAPTTGPSQRVDFLLGPPDRRVSCIAAPRIARPPAGAVHAPRTTPERVQINTL